MRSLALCAVLGASHARADPLASSPVRADYEPRQKRVLDAPWRADLERRGMRWNTTYAGEVFVAPALDDPVVGAGLFVLELELELGKLARTCELRGAVPLADRTAGRPGAVLARPHGSRAGHTRDARVLGFGRTVIP